MSFSRIIFALAFIASVSVLAIPPISVATNVPAGQMVLLHVRVTDPADNPVLDVPQAAFQVMEDGVPQKIELFMNEEIPLSYGLAIDCSGSLRSQISEVVLAGANIVKSNKPDDETFLVRFISSDKIETVQTLTSDKRLLLEGLDSLYIEAGQTAVIDAVYLSAELLAKRKTQPGEPRRKVLVLVTDGEDRVSYYKKDQLLQFLAASDTQIFTIALTKELKGDKRDRATKFLTQLATDTGGRTFFPSSPGDIERISKQIIKDIRTQYVIGYVPVSGDSAKAFHKVLVSIAENPNQEKRVAITRVGYSTQK